MGRIGWRRCSKKLAKKDIPEAGDRGVAYLLLVNYYHVDDNTDKELKGGGG